MLTDSELLRRYVEAADDAAFAQLLERHLGAVYGSALRRTNGNRLLAEEAVQVVFTQLAHKAPYLIRHPALVGWLHTSTRYAASGIVRREMRLAARHEAVAAMEFLHSDASPGAETLRPIIDQALDDLADADRQIVLLRFFDSKSLGEIGAAMGVSEDAARKRLERAMGSLRRFFLRRGVLTSASAIGTALQTAGAVVPPGTLLTRVSNVALTAATGSSHAPTTSALINVMSTAKISTATLLVCSAVGLITLGTAASIWSQQQAKEAAQFDALQGELSEIQTRLKSLASAAATTAPPTPGKASATAVDPVDVGLTQRRLLASSPAYARFREQAFRLRAQREFGALFETRHYSPEQAEALRRALARYYAAEEQLQLASTSTLSRDSLRKAVARERQQMLGELQAFVSEDEIRQINRCLQAQSAMPLARDASLEFADAGAPMDRVQELAFATIVAESADRMGSLTDAARHQAWTVDPGSGLAPEDRARLDDAAAFLTPTQLKLYEERLRRSHTLAELQARVRTLADASAAQP